MSHNSSIPASCTRCGALFPFRGIQFPPGVKVVLQGNTTNCPLCGGTAKIADGVFSWVNGIVDVIGKPDISDHMKNQLVAVARKAYEEKLRPEDVVTQAAAIHPSLGNLVERMKAAPLPFVMFLLLLIFVLNKCNITVNVDANQIVDRIVGMKPAEVLKIDPSSTVIDKTSPSLPNPKLPNLDR